MSPKLIDMVGKKLGRLTVLEFDHKDKRGESYWKCICECGNQKVVSGYKLRSGNTLSCGCLQQEHRRCGFHKTHNMTNSRLYYEWCNMRSRCNNKNSSSYPNYGGRGIKCCSEWNKFENFSEWALKNGYNDNLTIERIDVNGDYCPSNCKWITKQAQYLNRTDSHKITAFGETKTLKEWADEYGLKYDTLERRINCYKWDVEKAIITPVRTAK